MKRGMKAGVWICGGRVLGRGKVGWVGRKIGAGKYRPYIFYIVGVGFWEGAG